MPASSASWILARPSRVVQIRCRFSAKPISTDISWLISLPQTTSIRQRASFCSAMLCRSRSSSALLNTRYWASFSAGQMGTYPNSYTLRQYRFRMRGRSRQKRKYTQTLFPFHSFLSLVTYKKKRVAIHLDYHPQFRSDSGNPCGSPRLYSTGSASDSRAPSAKRTRSDPSL